MKVVILDTNDKTELMNLINSQSGTSGGGTSGGGAVANSDYVKLADNAILPTMLPSAMPQGTNFCVLTQGVEDMPEGGEIGIITSILYLSDATNCKQIWQPNGSVKQYVRVALTELSWGDWNAYTTDEEIDSKITSALTVAQKSGKFDGTDGYTPQKGVDYWTPSDKAEIISSVIEALGGEPIFGYVDENNNIVVQGNLADGTYSVKYEMENGTTVDIGELSLGAKPKNFSVPSEWTDNARLSISSGSTSTLAGHSTTNYIACMKGDVIQVTGLNIVGLIAPNNNDSSNAAKIVVYDSNKNKLGGLYSVASSEAQNYGAKVAVDGDISTYTILLNNEGSQIATDSARYIRIDGGLLSGYTKDDVIINIKRNGEWLTE